MKKGILFLTVIALSLSLQGQAFSMAGKEDGEEPAAAGGISLTPPVEESEEEEPVPVRFGDCVIWVSEREGDVIKSCMDECRTQTYNQDKARGKIPTPPDAVVLVATDDSHINKFPQEATAREGDICIRMRREFLNLPLLFRFLEQSNEIGRRVRELELPLKHLDPPSFQQVLPFLPNLMKLVFSGSPSNPENLPLLVKAISLSAPSLRSLTFYSVGMTPPQARILSPIISSLPCLVVLDVSGNPLGDGGIKSLAAVPLPSVETLTCRHCQIGRDGMEFLTHRIDCFPALRVIEGNEENGLRLLEGVIANPEDLLPSLEIINIDRCREITPAHQAQVQAMLRRHHIRIEGNFYDPQGNKISFP